MSSTHITAHDHSGSSGGSRGEKRRAARHRIEALVYLDLGLSNGGFPINVCEDGLAFQGIRPLQKDQLLSIRFKLPDLGHFVEVQGQIIWVNELGTGGGLRFVNLSDESRLVIRYWISAEKQCGGLEGKKEKDPVPVAHSKIELAPASAEQLPAQESSSAADKTNPIADEIAQSFSRPFAAGTEAIPATGSQSNPYHSKRPTLASRIAAIQLDTPDRRRWVTPFVFGLFTCVVVFAIGGLISLKFGRGVILGILGGNNTQMVSASTPATPPPSAPVSGIANRTVSGNDVARHAGRAATPAPIAGSLEGGVSSRPPVAAAHPAATPTRVPVKVKNVPPKKSLQQLTALTKALIPSRIVNHGATNVAPPAVTPLTGIQPAPQLSMGLPAPPAPSAVRPVQPVAKLEAAQLLVRNNPVYPPVARAAGLSGQVELQFTVGADGSVSNVKVVKGNSVLAQAAVAAVKSWRYQPARRGGIPTESKSRAVVIFNKN